MSMAICSSSRSSASSEAVWSSGIFSDPLIENTCPGAGQCAMSGHGNLFPSPTEVFYGDFKEKRGI